MDAFDSMVDRRVGEIEIVGSLTGDGKRFVMVKVRGANIIDFEGSSSFGSVMREVSAHFEFALAELIMPGPPVDTTWWPSLSSVR